MWRTAALEVGTQEGTDFKSTKYSTEPPTSPPSLLTRRSHYCGGVGPLCPPPTEGTLLLSKDTIGAILIQSIPHSSDLFSAQLGGDFFCSC